MKSAGLSLVFGYLISAVVMASPGKVAPPPAPEPSAVEAEQTTPPPPKPFEFADVELRARELATKSYARDDGGLPEFLGKLDYDQYRDIRYRAEKSIWRDESLPFQVQAFHRGFMFKDRVIINILDHGPVPE